MKRKTRILLTLTLIFIALIGIGIIWQWQNINTVKQAMYYSREELAIQIDQQKMQVEELLEKYQLEKVMDFSFEEEEAIRKGEITLEEAVAKVRIREEQAKAASGADQRTEVKSEPNSSQDGNLTNTAKPSSKALIQDTVSQMYVLKAKYIGKLGELERAALSEYKALSKEQRKNGGIKNIVSKYMPTGLATESSCDAEVASLLADLKAQLQQLNEPTDIIKEIQSAYESEKSLKKAYYLSLVKK